MEIERRKPEEDEGGRYGDQLDVGLGGEEGI